MQLLSFPNCGRESYLDCLLLLRTNTRCLGNLVKPSGKYGFLSLFVAGGFENGQQLLHKERKRHHSNPLSGQNKERALCEGRGPEVDGRASSHLTKKKEKVHLDPLFSQTPLEDLTEAECSKLRDAKSQIGKFVHKVAKMPAEELTATKYLRSGRNSLTRRQCQLTLMSELDGCPNRAIA